LHLPRVKHSVALLLAKHRYFTHNRDPEPQLAFFAREPALSGAVGAGSATWLVSPHLTFRVGLSQAFPANL
jgi:hypothetical protein